MQWHLHDIRSNARHPKRFGFWEKISRLSVFSRAIFYLWPRHNDIFSVSDELQALRAHNGGRSGCIRPAVQPATMTDDAAEVTNALPADEANVICNVLADQDAACSTNDTVTPESPPSSSSSVPTIRHPVKLFWHRTKVLWSQLTLSEVSGSVGDLGTLIPLTVAMARQRSIYLAPALFFAGLSNIITGYSWDVPMCVQPMKSIAAVAISEGLSVEQVTAAGMWMGAFCVLLGITQLIELVNIIVPLPVVSGLQLGVGLRLASKGLVMIADLPWVSQADCILLALLLSLLCMYWLREPSETFTPSPVRTWRNRLFCVNARGQHPVGLYLFIMGVIFATVELTTTDNANGQYDLPLQLFGAPIATNAIDSITWQDWKVGLLEGAIPQLPLTTLNSVISVCCLAHQLYPEKRRHGNAATDAVVSRREVCTSVGLMNLVFCPFGSMPNCHGAGGLAAQHRLGARHGSSVVFLGVNKALLAIFFGASALTILDAIPSAILGVMLAIAGQELSTTGFTLLVSSSPEKLKLRKNTVICIVTAMVIVGLGATHYGALAGWVTHMIYGDGGTDFVTWLRETDVRRGAWRTCWRRTEPQEEQESSPNDVVTEHSSGVSESSSDRVEDDSINRV